MEPPAAAGSGARVERAAVQRHSLAEAGEATAGAGDPGGRMRRVVLDDDDDDLVATLDPHLDVLCVCGVAEGVRESLLHEPVDRELQRRAR